MTRDDPLPSDWMEQIVRAYTVFGVEPDAPPLTGGAFDWMSKAIRSRLSAFYAKTRKRIKGRFAEEGKRYGSSGGGDVREVRADTKDIRADIDLTKPPPDAPAATPTPENPEVPQKKPRKMTYEERTAAVGAALWPNSSAPASTIEPPDQGTPRGSTDLGYELGGTRSNPDPEDTRGREAVVRDLINSYDQYVNSLSEGQQPVPFDQYITDAAETLRQKILEQLRTGDGQIKFRKYLDGTDHTADGTALKTQFEVGASTGLLSPEKRSTFEETTFGIHPDTAPHLRPVYGYIGGPTTAAQYGDAVFVLNPEAYDRVTITGGDSLDTDAGAGVPLRALIEGTAEPGDLFAAAGPKFRQQQLTEAATTGTLQQLPLMRSSNPSPYVEAQLHGGFPLSDVARIEINMETGQYRRPRETPSEGWFNNVAGLLPFDYTDDDVRDLFTRALSSTGFTVEDAGVEGSPLRDQWDDLVRRGMQMIEDGEVDSVYAVPGFGELLSALYRSKGFPIDVVMTGTPPDPTYSSPRTQKELEAPAKYQALIRKRRYSPQLISVADEAFIRRYEAWQRRRVSAAGPGAVDLPRR